jgi:hypothetical protein
LVLEREGVEERKEPVDGGLLLPFARPLLACRRSFDAIGQFSEERVGLLRRERS